MEVESSGTEFWTLQMRTEPLVAKGRKYSIKMKLKASKDVQFEIRIEGPLSHMETISLKAGEVKEFSTQTGKATEDKNCALFLALGNSGSGYDLWIDEIEFTAMDCSQPSGELLPRLSTLTRRHGAGRRYISVALFLKSPSAGVTRYPCPVEPGLSSQTGLSPRPRGCPACLPSYDTGKKPFCQIKFRLSGEK